MIIYLSGKMSGLPHNNHSTFNKWARHLRDRGFQVLNPAENDGGSTDKEHTFYMNLDMSNLLVCDAVVLIPGWETSFGSKLEIAVAQATGRSIYLLDEFIQGQIKPQNPKVKITIENERI
jgi:Domain of unknown function (DUF4406)